MTENGLFWGFVEGKVDKVSTLAHNEISWANVGK